MTCLYYEAPGEKVIGNCHQFPHNDKIEPDYWCAKYRVAPSTVEGEAHTATKRRTIAEQSE